MLLRAGDIERFARDAQPGDCASYGRGERPPSALVRAMSALVEAGVLAPVRKREGDHWLFLVQRGSAPLERAERRARGPVRRKTVRRSSLSMVLQCLTAAALAGVVCPSNEQIARRCHLSGKDSARYRVNLLVKKGRIAIEDRGPLLPRVVTVLTGRHAGKSTLRTPSGGK